MQMVSLRRFTPYTNRPSAETRISEVKTVPTNPGGRLETCCMFVKLPVARSNRQKMIVLPSSWIEYTQRPFGWKAKCRGPPPGGVVTKGVAAGIRGELPSTVSFQT